MITGNWAIQSNLDITYTQGTGPRCMVYRVYGISGVWYIEVYGISGVWYIEVYGISRCMVYRVYIISKFDCIISSLFRLAMVTS